MIADSKVAAAPLPSTFLEPREEMVADLNELAAALGRDPKTIAYHARNGRFGPRIRDGVHIYSIDKFEKPEDRLALDAWRAKGTRAVGEYLKRKKIFKWAEESYKGVTRQVGLERSNFVMEVKATATRERCTDPRACELVSQIEDRRVLGMLGDDKPRYPYLREHGLLTYNNFRKWLEIWNRWRDNDGDDSQWQCLCLQYQVAAIEVRETAAKRLQLTEAEVNKIRRLILDNESSPKANDGVPLAIEFMSKAPSTRPELREALQAILNSASGSIPPSIRRAIHVPLEVKLQYRSPKAFRESFVQIRDMTWINRLGQRVPVLPGDIREADDMTVNTPWWVEWPWGGDPCSDKYGVRCGRGQLLLSRDVASGKGVSFWLMMRYKDSYRASDILQWKGCEYRDMGMPRIAERLERGSWEARRIEGVPLFRDDGSFECRFAGIRDLGFALDHTFSANAKLQEQWHGMLQKVMGNLGPQVGRHRGEYELISKDLLACQDARLDPREVFPHIDQLADGIFDCISYLNQRKIKGRLVYGVPDELWSEHINDANPLPTLPREKEWMFLPDYAERTITGGCLQISRHDDRERFTFEIARFVNDGVGDGFRVIAFFDPALPEMGAWLFNKETRPCNVRNWPLGHFIGIAPYIDPMPQHAASQPVGSTGGRSRLNAAVRTAYIGMGVFGRPSARMREKVETNGVIHRISIGKSLNATDVSGISVTSRTEVARDIRREAAVNQRRAAGVRAKLRELVDPKDREHFLTGKTE